MELFSQSDAINELATALSEAQGAAKAASKNSKNPYYGSKYADLEEIRIIVKEFYASRGIAVAQLPLEAPDDKTIRLLTVIMHKSGQWIRSVASFPAPPLPKKGGAEGQPSAQAHGSAISYARRYALASALGITADEDDDGNAASGARHENTAKEEAPAPRISADELAMLLSPISEAVDLAALDRICGAIARSNPHLREQVRQAHGVRKAVLEQQGKAAT